MTVIEYAPDRDTILDYVNDAIRRLQEDGVEPKYILMGPAAYDRMREAMGERFRREAGTFETYNFFPLVVDPFRDDTVCVLPAPIEVSKGIHAVRMEG
jgi:hypothetical protein